MPTYQLTIEYEGTRYSGWQAQGNTQKTVQGHLLRAAREVLGDVVWWIRDALDFEAMQRAAATIAGRHDFSAFTDKRLAPDESRIVVVERCEAARAGDLILVRIAASHFLWKMVRKLISFFVEVGRGNETQIASRLRRNAEPYAPTAPPSGLFLEAIVYENQSFDRPLLPIVPVESPR